MASSPASSDGSSPLARGLLTGGGARVVADGIIPARAGFTERFDSAHGRETDHPRSRGVYSRRFLTVYCIAGSSPLARGLQGEEAGLEALVGIIPARAGFTDRTALRPPRA